MKARNFRYIRPASLHHAYRILAENDGDTMPLAGGQSLLAGLNMRLSAPKILVDIGELKELAGESYTDGIVRLGALTLHRELLGSQLVQKHVPLLARGTSQFVIAAPLAAVSPMPTRQRSCQPAPWRSARRWC